MRWWHRALIPAILACVIILAAMALVRLTCISCGDSGFTLIIKGAPNGTQVFIDNIDKPVGTVQENGDIAIKLLRSDRTHQVRLRHEEAVESFTNVSDQDGERKEIVAHIR